ncbi:MAG: sulfite exporter TauE/SafE family protein [Phycisphaerae bacterium]
MQLWDYLFLMPLGLIAGSCGGLLGIGGSVVMIPAMALMFGSDQQHLYQATAMIVNFFVVAPAVLRHMRARATIRSVTRIMIPSAIAGAIVGVRLSELPVFKGVGQGYLQIIFATFLAYVLAHNLLRMRATRGASAGSVAPVDKPPHPIAIILVGLPTGLLGGLLGIGGGLYAVPAQQVCLRLPLPNAIANSAATILWSSVVGAILKNAGLASHAQSWSHSVLMAACLIPTAMIGSWFAAGRVHHWPVNVIRAIFSILLAYCAVRLFLLGWNQLSM